MNERIKELAEQAIQEVAPGVEYKIMLSPAVEKFAELIVRECADYANWYQANSRYTDIAKAIKEHFGVEEQEKVLLKPKCSVCGTTENVKYTGGYQPYLCDSVDCIPF